MIIVDTAVWIDHIRAPIPGIGFLLTEGKITQHPMVTAEIALGSLGPRTQMVGFLRRLPVIAPVTDDALLAFVEHRALFGIGIGYVDAHLLAACDAGGHSLWTRDRKLAAQAERLDLAYRPA